MREEPIKLLSTRQFADRLEVVSETVRRWIKSGLIKPYGKTVAGHYRFTEAQVQEALNRYQVIHKSQSFDISRHVQTALQKVKMRRRAS
ncbi:MAG: helix-turn-helix domain-containing protein [Planctomycetota bacterium]|nr:helix-turn-helix domain-containing protein [Planctomycetota bacterium]